MNKEIRKAKITSNGTLEVILFEHHPDKTDREVNIKCQQLAHIDMQNAFKKLVFHLAFICDLHEAKNLTPDDFKPEFDLTKFKVTSFSIGGNDDSSGVTITGQKELEGGKILNLNSPFQMYEDEFYLYGSDLAADIHACVFEVEQYMFEGKYAIKQLEIDFEENAQDAIDNLRETLDAANVTMEVSSPRKKSKKLKLSSSEKVMELGEVATY